MTRLKVCLVYFLVAWTGVAECSYEEELWDRFRFWFHTMDHNYDGLLSLEDVENCTSKHVSPSLNFETVRAKCEEFLPRWFHFFPLRGEESLTENAFIAKFREERDEDVEQFEKIIYQASKLFWIIIDMNNDRVITGNEDACVGDRQYDTSVLSISFAHYLLVGRIEQNIQDIFCPWIY